MTLGYRYACCEHCEYQVYNPEAHIDGHTIPCEYGCNDGEGTA
jgi:hypothetical protein